MHESFIADSNRPRRKRREAIVSALRLHSRPQSRFRTSPRSTQQRQRGYNALIYEWRYYGRRTTAKTAGEIERKSGGESCKVEGAGRSCASSSFFLVAHSPVPLRHRKVLGAHRQHRQELCLPIKRGERVERVSCSRREQSPSHPFQPVHLQQISTASPSVMSRAYAA